MQIAVLVDPENHVAAFEQGGVLKKYEKLGGAWTAGGEYVYNIAGLASPAAFRQRLREVCDWMGPCKILAAERFRGTYRAVFEPRGISMWEMSGFSKMTAEQFLDDISEFQGLEAERQRTAPSGAETSPAPAEQSPGRFVIDLTDVMGRCSSLNSQQILLPFFRSTPFEALEIICDHVPKWFERELGNFNLKSEVRRGQDALHVCLYPEK